MAGVQTVYGKFTCDKDEAKKMPESYGIDMLFRLRRRDRSLHVSVSWQYSHGVCCPLINVLTVGQVLLEAVDGIVNEICKGLSTNLGVGLTLSYL